MLVCASFLSRGVIRLRLMRNGQVQSSLKLVHVWKSHRWQEHGQGHRATDDFSCAPQTVLPRPVHPSHLSTLAVKKTEALKREREKTKQSSPLLLGYYAVHDNNSAHPITGPGTRSQVNLHEYKVWGTSLAVGFLVTRQQPLLTKGS